MLANAARFDYNNRVFHDRMRSACACFARRRFYLQQQVPAPYGEDIWLDRHHIVRFAWRPWR